MKKLLALLLVFSICVTLCACAKGTDVTNTDTKSEDTKSADTKSAAAKKVDEQILAIGDVTRDSKVAIDDAMNSYNALTEEEKSTIENYDILEQAQVSYLEALISAIDDVTLSDKELILQARSYYDTLTDEQKKMANFQEELNIIENDYAKIEAYEELRDLFKTKGKWSDIWNAWIYDGIEASKYGDIEYRDTIDIENTDTYYDGKTVYFPNTYIAVTIGEEQFDVYFASRLDAYASMNDIELADGKIDGIKFADYSIGGELPEFTNCHTVPAMSSRYDMPFESEDEYYEYICGVIHNQIFAILSSIKNGLGFDITRLGFSEDVANGIA